MTVAIRRTINNYWKRFILGLVYITMKNGFVSESSWNELIFIASIILLQLTSGTKAKNIACSD